MSGAVDAFRESAHDRESRVFEVVPPLREAAGGNATPHSPFNHRAAQRRGVEADGLLKQGLEIIHRHGICDFTPDASAVRRFS